MRYSELFEAWDEYAELDGNIILRNPGPKELDFLINQSNYKAVRIGFDTHGDLLVWSADNLTHQDVDMVTDDGYTMTKDLSNRTYPVWADQGGYDEKGWNRVRNNPHIRAMTRGKDIWKPESAAEFWANF